MEELPEDPYVPYDGGGDTIPLQELPKKGTKTSTRIPALIVARLKASISIILRLSLPSPTRTNTPHTARFLWLNGAQLIAGPAVFLHVCDSGWTMMVYGWAFCAMECCHDDVDCWQASPE